MARPKDPEAPIRAWLDSLCALALVVSLGAAWKAAVTPGETAQSRAAERAAAERTMPAEERR